MAGQKPNYDDILQQLRNSAPPPPPPPVSAVRQGPFDPQTQYTSATHNPIPEKTPMALPSKPADNVTLAATDTFDMFKDAVTSGLKAGAASELAERLVVRVEALMGSQPFYPSILKTSLGRTGLSYALPVVLYFGAKAFPERVPMADKVAAVCKWAILGHSVKAVAPIFVMLEPLWVELASMAEKIDDKPLRSVP